MKYLAVILFLFTGCKSYRVLETGENYPAYGGNNAGNRFSPLKGINVENVNQLRVAWTYNAADSSVDKNKKGIECQPIVVDGKLYGVTADLKLFALNAATGQQLWISGSSIRGYKSWSRGINYWQEGDDKRILYCAGSNIYAVNAATGTLIETFGQGGKVDLHEGLEGEGYDAKNLAITATSPGVIYKDILVLGSTVSEEGDALPGHIRGFNVRTGKLTWIFHTIPHPGEPGYDTWPQDAYKKTGGVNCWSGMVLDQKTGIVYLGTGSPSPNFYGGNRQGKNLFANCILALDSKNGELKWYYQTIHHDLWDYDIPCPPNLVTVQKNGSKIDAVVQTTKDGLVYVLDRKTGASLFPVEEREVPVDGLPGEYPWATQKFPLKPLPFTRQIISEADMPDSNFFPDAFLLFRQRFPNTRSGFKYIPPGKQGTIAIGISGGAEWGGNAVDPEGILYQNASETPWDVKLTEMSSVVKKGASKGNVLYMTKCAACHGEDRKGSANVFPNLENIGNKYSFGEIKEILNSGRGRMPSFQSITDKDKKSLINFLLHTEPLEDAAGDENTLVLSGGSLKSQGFPYVPPYITKNRIFKDKNGYPAIQPPWGTLNAIDLNTGDYLWRVPLGEYPELTKKGIPLTGTDNSGGPLVTSGGLVFIAGTDDERIRAFDKNTGKTVWEYQLPAGAFATPITYEAAGKQYVVIAAGGVRNGHQPGGWYIAFALK